MKKALFIGLFVCLALSCSDKAEEAGPGSIAKNAVTINGTGPGNKGTQMYYSLFRPFLHPLLRP